MTATRILKTEIVDRRYAGKDQYAVFTIASTDGTKEYRVDSLNKRCSCGAWKFAKLNPVTGKKPMCKHLLALGFTDDTQRV